MNRFNGSYICFILFANVNAADTYSRLDVDQILNSKDVNHNGAKRQQKVPVKPMLKLKII